MGGGERGGRGRGMKGEGRKGRGGRKGEAQCRRPRQSNPGVEASSWVRSNARLGLWNPRVCVCVCACGRVSMYVSI